MIRPILDGIVVRMDPPAEKVGSLHIPEDARAETGTWRAQREAKIGTVIAVGPGRAKPRRTAWERDPKKMGPLDEDETRRKWDTFSEGSVVPMTVKVGDRVLFDPMAELRRTDDPSVWVGAEYQVAAILDRAESSSGTDYEMGERT